MAKVALVTGGASGIGRATCLEFSKLGCRVVVVDVNEAGGEETLQQVSGGQALMESILRHFVCLQHSWMCFGLIKQRSPQAS